MIGVVERFQHSKCCTVVHQNLCVLIPISSTESATVVCRISAILSKLEDGFEDLKQVISNNSVDHETLEIGETDDCIVVDSNFGSVYSHLDPQSVRPSRFDPSFGRGSKRPDFAILLPVRPRRFDTRGR